MDYANLLGDSNSGLLASATSAGKSLLLSKTEDNNTLHPLLTNLLGGPSNPSPATPETKVTAPANLPQTDLPMEESFFSKYKWWLIGGAVGVLVLGGGLKLMK